MLAAIVGAISASSFSIVHREADGKIALRGLAYQKDDLAEVEKNEGKQAALIVLDPG